MSADRTHQGMRPRLQSRIDRWSELLAEDPFKRAWSAITAVTIVVTIVGGALVRLTDPTSISSFANGFWWSAQTITTVGYGDLVPHSTAGRATAVVVMLAGLSFVAVTTAAVTNAFVQAATRRRDTSAENGVLAELRSLRRELAELRTELPAVVPPSKDPPEPRPPDTAG
jgi:voltage-gated potassium channel Kch